MEKVNTGEAAPTAKAPERRGPALEVRMGRVRLAAWRNVTTEGQEWYSFVPSRTYKEGDTWKSAGSFGADDLLVLAALCTQMRLRLEQQRQEARQDAEYTEEVIAFLESRFGDYPANTAGGIYLDTPTGFALETQGTPTYPPDTTVDLLVHELAHQWYGNSVSIQSWADICLSECFASYAAWLWSEEKDGTMSVGRNDPCPCGSGNKFKKCCLPKQEAERRERAKVAREEAAKAPPPAAEEEHEHGPGCKH